RPSARRDCSWVGGYHLRAQKKEPPRRTALSTTIASRSERVLDDHGALEASRTSGERVGRDREVARPAPGLRDDLLEAILRRAQDVADAVRHDLHPTVDDREVADLAGDACL